MIQLLDNYEDSGIECPSCEQTTLEVIRTGTEPDNTVTYLRCNNCMYEEKE